MKITPEQKDILSAWKIEWNKFYLQWQLDRKQYVSINEVFETIGLKWNRKEKAHIFDWEMLEDAILDIVESGECITLKETIKKFQFYPTPPEVADRLISLADIHDGAIVLEPSAGTWAILDAIERKGRWRLGKLFAIELDPIREEALKDKCDILYIEDFLDHTLDWYSRIIMNPPFAKSQDVKHILHAYSLLKEWGTIVSIASASIQTRSGSLYDDLHSLSPEYIELPSWSFKDSLTMVNTIIVRINK